MDEGEEFLKNGEQPILMVESKGHAVHVFVNEELIGTNQSFLYVHDYGKM